MRLATRRDRGETGRPITVEAAGRAAFEAHFKRLSFGYRILPFYKNARSSATYQPAEPPVQGSQ
jgi:hypothetical protein